MTMTSAWQWATGSVQGREHWLARRNNQDAACVLAGPDAIAAVVADGCGSSPHSEVGARLVAELLSRALLARAGCLTTEEPAAALLEDAAADVLTLLGRLAGESLPWVRDHLLTTALGVVVTDARAVVFRIGDGIVGVNGAFATRAAPANAPPYLAYRLLPPDRCRLGAEEMEPVVEWEGPGDALASVVLATDGAAELPPDGPDEHGTLRAWLGDERLYRQPVALTRRLTRLARDEQVVDWGEQRLLRRSGTLRDDTTLLLLRRRLPAQPEG